MFVDKNRPATPLIEEDAYSSKCIISGIRRLKQIGQAVNLDPSGPSGCDSLIPDQYALVAQWQEAASSNLVQYQFESDREYHLFVIFENLSMVLLVFSLKTSTSVQNYNIKGANSKYFIKSDL